MGKQNQINLLGLDSDAEDLAVQAMKICLVGQLKPKFKMDIDTELDEVIEVKSKILRKLGAERDEDWEPTLRKMRLFSLKGGIELMDSDLMEGVGGQEYLFYSFGDPFDYQIRMDLIEKKQKLGEGGFGSVYLAYDKTIGQEVAIKVLNFQQNSKMSHMFTKEIEALGQLKHKNIVKLYDYFPLPKKQQLIVVMEYLQGGELYDLWKLQPHRCFAEKKAYRLIYQILSAINYCHMGKIIHRDLKFQNIMIARPPVYDEKEQLDIDSVDLKIVDFGIFGSIAGIRMENINCGSLKYMAPELLVGQTHSTPKIDIWSIGLMFHALLIGWLPFNKQDRPGLESQIKFEELNYKHIKKLKNATIKDDYRKALNYKLKKISDDAIDLMEKMLTKDPLKRIDMIEIYEHPWVEKYKAKLDDWSDTDGAEDDQLQVSNSDEDTNSVEQEGDTHDEQSSDYSRSNSLQSEVRNNQCKKRRQTQAPSCFQKQFMFNIQENENETTGNYVNIDLKQKIQEMEQQEKEAFDNDANESQPPTRSTENGGSSSKLKRRNTIGNRNKKHNSFKNGAGSETDEKPKSQRKVMRRSSKLEAVECEAIDETNFPEEDAPAIADARPSISVNGRDQTQYVISKQVPQMKKKKVKIVKESDNTYEQSRARQKSFQTKKTSGFQDNEIDRVNLPPRGISTNLKNQRELGQRHVIEGPREGRVAHFTRLNSQGIGHLNEICNSKSISTGEQIDKDASSNNQSQRVKKRKKIRENIANPATTKTHANKIQSVEQKFSLWPKSGGKGLLADDQTEKKMSKSFYRSSKQEIEKIIAKYDHSGKEMSPSNLQDPIRAYLSAESQGAPHTPQKLSSKFHLKPGTEATTITQPQSATATEPKSTYLKSRVSMPTSGRRQNSKTEAQKSPVPNRYSQNPLKPPPQFDKTPDVLLLTDQSISQLAGQQPVGHQGDILRLRQQPSQTRRRDIPYFRNSAATQKTKKLNYQENKDNEPNPFQIAVEGNNPNNNSGNSSTTQATSNNQTLERSRTQDFFKYGGLKSVIAHKQQGLPQNKIKQPNQFGVNAVLKIQNQFSNENPIKNTEQLVIAKDKISFYQGGNVHPPTIKLPNIKMDITQGQMSPIKLLEKKMVPKSNHNSNQ